MKKVIALTLAVLMLASSIGCSNNKTNSGRNADGKIIAEIGNWPSEAAPLDLERKEAQKKEFEEKYTDIEIVPNTYAYEVKSFVAKAAANQLPGLLLNLPYTEIKNVIKNGYAADITEVADEYGMRDALSPQLLNMCTDENDRLYAIPRVGYMMGIMINKELFKQAGLVNDDGTVKIPQTFEELAEYASIIKEKTGAAGFAMPTTNNVGGWILLNIAWNYGVEFEKQNEDGTWTATFDSPEFHKALEWLYDLKWNKNALPDNSVIDAKEMMSMLGTNRAAMIIGHSDWCNTLAKNYGMDKANLAIGKIPAGPAARYSQMGGSLCILSPSLTDEQKKAIFKWLAFVGLGPKIDEETLRQSLEVEAGQGGFIFPKELFRVWESEERTAVRERVAADYANIDMKDFEDYNLDGVTLRAEPEVCAQQLYSELDKVIQEILTNKDVDIPAISKKAQKDFQTNHLDKIN